VSLFLTLYLGHLLGDFLLQPGRLVLAKREGAAGLLLHTLVVGLASAAVLFSTLRVDWAAIVLVTGMHLCIERLTIMTYVRTPTRGLFTLLFDQTLHLLSITLVVWLAGDWSLDAHAFAFGLRVPVVGLATIDALLTVMLLGSILAFEPARVESCASTCPAWQACSSGVSPSPRRSHSAHWSRPSLSSPDSLGPRRGTADSAHDPCSRRPPARRCAH
jgi:hypothetical protein